MAQPCERVPPLSRRELFGASLGVAPQLQPLQGMLLRPSTDICPKELTRDMRGFSNSLPKGTDAFSSRVKGTNPLAAKPILSSAICFFTVWFNCDS